jgi:teichuronic acid biosynthesis glycosyltransferase TuaH
MPEKRLIWLAEVPWTGLTQRHHQLIRSLQRLWNILYIQPAPAGRFPNVLMARREGRIRVVEVAPLVNSLRTPLAEVFRSRRARTVGGALGAMQVTLAARRTGWTSSTNTVVVVCSNIYLASTVRAVKPELVVLDLADDPRYFPRTPAWASEFLQQSIALADLITTPSSVLETELRGITSQPVVRVSNGVLGSMIGGAHVPAHTATPPVVGYVGQIAPWLDLELLDTLASALPQVRLALVGPIDRSVAGIVEHLARRPNVSVRSTVPHASLSEVLSSFSVGLIPFRLTPLTRATNPNKLYEYAAHNLPIIATAFSPDLTPFAKSIAICNTPREFVNAVSDGLSIRSDPGTRWIASANTWESIGRRFGELIETALEHRS